MKKTKKTSGQKPASEVKQPITLVDIENHLKRMEKSDDRNLGVDLMAIGLATTTIGIELRAHSWPLIPIGLVVALIGVVFVCRAVRH